MEKNKKELEDYLKSHLQRRRYAKKTERSYIYWVMRIGDFFGKYQLTEFDKEDVFEFIKHLDEKQALSTGTIRIAEHALHFLFNTLNKRDYQIRGYRSKRPPRVQQYVPTQKEIIKIIEQIPSKRTQLAATLLYASGLTLQEVINLKKTDIDFENNSLTVAMGPGKKARQTVLSEYIKPKLYSYIREAKSSKWIFETDDGKQVGTNNIYKAIVKGTKELNLNQQITPKSFKFAYIKHLESIGFHLLDIFDELGMVPFKEMMEYYSNLDRKKRIINVSPIDRRISPNFSQSKQIEENFYVSKSRINELSEMQYGKFDLTKLLELLRELNVANQHQMYLSIAILIRSIMDHIPPFFGFRTFSELANNYSGSKSFKKQMNHMNKSLRNIADSFLHMPIRTSEVLPNFNQVDFRADLDVLLSEMIRLSNKNKN